MRPAIKVTYKLSILGIWLLLISGCATQHQLMPTPTLYAGAKPALFDNLAAELKQPSVEIFYLTDRLPETDEAGRLHYGYQRSTSLAAGTAVVEFGQNVSWSELVATSQGSTRQKNMQLRLVSTSELTRLPPEPIPYSIIDGEIVDDPVATAAQEATIAQVGSEITRRLALTSRKDIFFYVHGYHNTFKDAAFALAETWHFLGREGLPMMYTWPAGYPGLFGYSYDRESSEFTVYHLKHAISWLAALPEVKNIHIIAHSRGTDVVLSALRELNIAARNAGINPRERFKIANLVLAAPDLDVSVVNQRVVAERLGWATGHITIYSSPEDKAIGLAEKLFVSPRGRLGRLTVDDLDQAERNAIDTNVTNFTTVHFDGKSGGGIGHSYFRTSPAVSSDLVLLLRYGFKAGQPQRPLQQLESNFWRIPPGYPQSVEIP